MELTKPEEAVKAARAKLTDRRKEHFIAFYLDARSRVVHSEVVSIGTVDSTLVHPREVFRPAIAKSASGVITLHNHPSGIVEPSDSDIEIHRRLRDAGRIIGIRLVDSIVFSSRGAFHSFASDNQH